MKWIPIVGLGFLVLNPVARLRLSSLPDLGQNQEPVVKELPPVKDVRGREVVWFKESPCGLILYFHQPHLRYSKRGLEELVAQLQKEKALQSRTQLVVVIFDSSNQEEVLQVVKPIEDLAQVVYASSREVFQGFQVIAHPTSFVLNAQSEVVQKNRGYGPQLALRLAVAGRFAAGQMDRETFESLESGMLPEHVIKKKSKLHLHVELARNMALEGKIEAAVEELGQAMRDSPQDQAMEAAMELMFRLHCLLKDTTNAEKTLDQLKSLYPTHPNLALLACRLALLEGKLEDAENLLAPIRPRLFPEANLLRGILFEARGDFREAATLYRQQLELQVLQTTDNS